MTKILCSGLFLKSSLPAGLTQQKAFEQGHCFLQAVEMDGVFFKKQYVLGTVL